MHDWKTIMDGYKLFQNDWNERRGGGAALYEEEKFECTGVCQDHKRSIKCLWIKIRGVDIKGDLVLGICFQSSNQDGKAGKILLRLLTELSGQQNLVLRGDFNYRDVCCENNTSGCSQQLSKAGTALAWALTHPLPVSSYGVGNEGDRASLRRCLLLWPAVCIHQSLHSCQSLSDGQSEFLLSSTSGVVPLRAPGLLCLLLWPQGHLDPFFCPYSSTAQAKEQVMLLFLKCCLPLSPNFLLFS